MSHLQCLAADFLAQEQSKSAILPRGGTCKSCNSYTLWGDIIRGCYRRHTGGAAVDLEDDDIEGELGQDPTRVQQEQKKRTKTAMKSRSKTTTFTDAEEEIFDLDGINSDSSDNMQTVLKRANKPAAKDKSKVPQPFETEGEFFDLDGIGSDSEPAPKRGQRLKKLKSAANPPVVVATDSEGEFFDLDGINSESSNPVEKPKSRTTGLARTLSQLSISSPGSDIIDISD